MSLQEINELTLEDCLLIIRERLELADDDSGTEEELQAEFELYIQELIAAEEARLAEVARLEDLESRYYAMSDSGLLHQVTGLSNPTAYFRDSIYRNSDKAEAESNLATLEAGYSTAHAELQANEWLECRKKEYAKIDNLLMEALAEKEAGNTEKMDAYLLLREQIKTDYPKPE